MIVGSKQLKCAIDRYNSCLKELANKILDLSIKDTISMNELNALSSNMSVVNSITSRRNVENLLKDVITEYGYILETKVRNES